MAGELTIRYDPLGDILFLWKTLPHPEQVIDMLEADVLMRSHSVTGEIEGYDLLFFSQRMAAGESLLLPGNFDLSDWQHLLQQHKPAA